MKLPGIPNLRSKFHHQLDTLRAELLSVVVFKMGGIE